MHRSVLVGWAPVQLTIAVVARIHENTRIGSGQARLIAVFRDESGGSRAARSRAMKKTSKEDTPASDDAPRVRRRGPGGRRSGQRGAGVPARPESQQQAEHRVHRRPAAAPTPASTSSRSRPGVPPAGAAAPTRSTPSAPHPDENVTVLCDVNDNAIEAASERFPKAQAVERPPKGLRQPERVRRRRRRRPPSTRTPSRPTWR